MQLHDLAEQRSLAYHRRVAEFLAGRPELVESARVRASAWAASGASHAPHAREWVALLEGPRERLVNAMTADSEHARALRQATPFAGALDPRERWRLWSEVRARWEAG